MKIKNLLIGISIYDCNCYGIETEKAAIIIDPSVYSDTLTEFFRKNAEKQKVILITHAHHDHISGAERLRKETGVKIGVGELDAAGLSNPEINLSANSNLPISFEADYTYADNEEITVGDLNVKVMQTPGHTKGSVCYLIGDKLFSGDTLFCESVGRTDLPTGSFADLRKSLERLKTLPKSTSVLTGHGRETTIDYELRYNPYVLGMVYY